MLIPKQIGGSHGFVCVALAKKFPQLSFVVQDMPKTVADGPSKIPAEFKNKIEFQAHDFYTEQPIKDAAVYFFRWICHNQSDKYGTKMLQALVPAMKKGARIVINDNCLPKPNTADPWDEKITRYVRWYFEVVRRCQSFLFFLFIDCLATSSHYINCSPRMLNEFLHSALP